MSGKHVIEREKIRKLIHELNNALNVAKMNAFLLHSKLTQAADQEALKSLKTGLEKAEGLIREFCILEMDPGSSTSRDESNKTA